MESRNLLPNQLRLLGESEYRPRDPGQYRHSAAYINSVIFKISTKTFLTIFKVLSSHADSIICAIKKHPTIICIPTRFKFSLSKPSNDYKISRRKFAKKRSKIFSEKLRK